MDETAPKTVPAESGETDAATAAATSNPWQSLVEMRRDMDRMFEDFSSRFGGARLWPGTWAGEPFQLLAGSAGKLAPALDIVENDTKYTVTAEVPGLAEEDVDVSVSQGTLTIKGEKREEKDEEKDNLRVSERRYGSLMRSIRLPEDIDAEKIDASYAKGVVTITLPKRADAAAKERKIPVKGK